MEKSSHCKMSAPRAYSSSCGVSGCSSTLSCGRVGGRLDSTRGLVIFSLARNASGMTV